MRARRTPLPATIALCALLGRAPLQAQATAYARQTVTDILVTPGIANDFQLLRTGTGARSHAELFSLPGAAADAKPLDANMACQGGGCGGLTNNDFALNPLHLAKGDALIRPDLRSARNDALVNLSRADAGVAFGTNYLEADVRLALADVLLFTFTDAPFLVARLPANAVVGAGAGATISFSISIRDLAPGAGLREVFFWEPDGAPGNITGGVESADPTSLNEALTQNGPGNQPNYDPGAKQFAANTNALAAGDYRIAIDIVETARAEYFVSPEPSAVALLTTGVAGVALLGARRRR